MPRVHLPLQTLEVFAASFGSRSVSLAEASAVGLTRHQLRAAVGRRLIEQPRHGLYRIASQAEGSEPSYAEPPWLGEHRLAVAAALKAVGRGAFATHDSAAVILDHPRPDAHPPARVSLALPGCADFTGPGLVVRGSVIPSAFVVIQDGLPTTDVRRTAIDLARGRSLAQALIPLDAAARRLVESGRGVDGRGLRWAVHEPASRELARRELSYALSSCAGWPGVVAARRALTWVEPAAESPFESRSRAWFLQAGLPALEIGAEVRVRGRTYWADFCSRTHRVIGEADGWAKYGADMSAVRASLTDEKQRHADLESDGWRIIRWTTQDHRTEVVGRLARALSSP